MNVPTGFFGSTTNMNASSDTSSTVLSSTFETQCAYTSLGGEYRLTLPAVSVGTNILGIFGYQSPVPYSLYLTDISIVPPFITTALGATISNIEIGLGVSSTNSPANSTTLMPLTMFAAAISAPANTFFSGNNFIFNLSMPIVVPSGQYLIVWMKLISAPTTGAIRGSIYLNGYFE